jgi:hypothetical protein
MLIEAEQVDAVENRAAGLGELPGDGDRVPVGLTDPQDRRARIRAAARELSKQSRHKAEAEQLSLDPPMILVDDVRPGAWW